MSFIFNNEISYSDGPNIDGFGRLRVSTPLTLFDSKFLVDKDTLFWDEKIVSGGTILWTSASTVELSVGTSVNSRLVRQSKKYFHYQPGKSLLVFCSGVLNVSGGTNNVVSKIGFFDDRQDKIYGLLNGNGIFFQLSGTTLQVVKRTTINSVQTDTVVNQSSWNLDRMDGTSGSTNPSGVNIDVSKTQIFTIDLEWLGVGRVRMGFVINGQIIYCHEFNHANSLNVPYMNTASLPIRYEIHNISGSSTPGKLIQICSSSISEGGFEKLGRIFSSDRGSTSRSVSANATFAPLLSIRLSTGATRNQVDVEKVNVICSTGAPTRWHLTLNPALTGTSWVSNNTASSYTEKDLSATAMSGGTLIASGYFTTQTNEVINRSIETLLSLNSNIDGTSDVLTLGVDNLNNQAETYYASITYRETN